MQLARLVRAVCSHGLARISARDHTHQGLSLEGLEELKGLESVGAPTRVQVKAAPRRIRGRCRRPRIWLDALFRNISQPLFQRARRVVLGLGQQHVVLLVRKAPDAFEQSTPLSSNLNIKSLLACRAKHPRAIACSRALSGELCQSRAHSGHMQTFGASEDDPSPISLTTNHLANAMVLSALLHQ